MHTEQISQTQQIIARLKADANLSQADIAALIDSDQSTVSRWAAGRLPENVMSHMRLIELARQHGIDVSPASAQQSEGVQHG